MSSDLNNTKNNIIEKEEAIKNLGGMVWLYEKHLLKFVNTYADSAYVTREYLNRGQSDQAQILIHSIKGLAGTLGLQQLYSSASLLEHAIKNADVSTSIYLNNYEICLKETILKSQED
jgi:HPt (histidine-containing phosphotransfer) domain-containing protein